MKLSELVFEVVKNVVYLSDDAFQYDAFIQGDFDSDPDYKNSINNVFTPLNEAIHRLSDRGKLKNKIEKIPSPNSTGLIKLPDEIRDNVKTILNIFTLKKNGYEHLEFREFGNNILLMSRVSSNEEIYIEYEEDIRNFTRSDIFHYDEVDVANDVDLKEYGISNTMCSYIIEYCQGRLQEPLAPELANMHLTRAEQYFDDLPEQNTTFNQNRIKVRQYL